MLQMPQIKCLNNLIQPQTFIFFVLILVCHICSFKTIETAADVLTDPKFSFPIANVTASVGREASLTCVVQDLGSYKVAWLRVDTQTILTIQNHVITKNTRVSIINSEHKTWTMKIKDIKKGDKGWYMCQINTDPMKSQMGYLDVVVPPDILDYPTSTDMVVREGSNVTLKCAATGMPEPTITWRRENSALIELANGTEVPSIEGVNLELPRIKRQHMGPYLCIASNQVPPTVSKRIMVTVHFPPMISVQNQLIGAVEGKSVTLECQSEAYPKSINYWTHENGDIVSRDENFDMNVTEVGEYRNSMKLFIHKLTKDKFRSYKCVAKNSLGDTDGAIKLYKIPANTVNSVDNFEGRYKGKKRIKSSEHYRLSKVTENSEEAENPSKRKDFIPGSESDNGFYGNNSADAAAVRRQQWQHKLILTSTVAVVLLLQATRQLTTTTSATVPSTLTHV